MAPKRFFAKAPPKFTHTCQRLQREESATLATRMEKSLMSRTSHTKQRSRPQNVPKVPRLPHRMDTARLTKNEHGALVKRAPILRSRNAHGHLTRELLCKNLQQKKPGNRWSTQI
jgi:hypothetical protein